MKYLIHSLMFGLFLLPSGLISSEKKAPTAEEKKQWAADAEKWKRMATALQGKTGEKAGNQTNTELASAISQQIHHKQAKL